MESCLGLRWPTREFSSELRLHAPPRDEIRERNTYLVVYVRKGCASGSYSLDPLRSRDGNRQDSEDVGLLDCLLARRK